MFKDNKAAISLLMSSHKHFLKSDVKEKKKKKENHSSYSKWFEPYQQAPQHAIKGDLFLHEHTAWHSSFLLPMCHDQSTHNSFSLCQ